MSFWISVLCQLYIKSWDNCSNTIKPIVSRCPKDISFYLIYEQMICPRLKMSHLHGPFTFLSRWALARETDYFTGWLKTKKYWTEVKMFPLIAGVEIWTAVYGGHMDDLGTIFPHQNLCPFFVYQCRYCDKAVLVRNHLVDVLNEKRSKEQENLKMLKFFQLYFICFRKYYMKIHRQLIQLLPLRPLLGPPIEHFKPSS